VVEARRLEIRWVRAYLVGGIFVAISVTAPLFLIARERRLAARVSAPAPSSPSSAPRPASFADACSAGWRV